MLHLNSLSVLDFVDSYYIYGHGSCGRHLFELLKDRKKISFRGFVDKEFTDVSENRDYPTLSPDNLLKEASKQNDCIIVASSFFPEITQFLIESGFRRIVVYPERGFEMTGSIPKIIFKYHPSVQEKNFLRGGYDNEKNTRKIIDEILPYTIVSYDGLLSISELIQFVLNNEIGGSIVELGCNKGGCVGLMAKVLLNSPKETRVIHAFDSFLGLPESLSPHDDKNMLTEWKDKGNLAASDRYLTELVLEKFNYPKELLKVHKGFFDSTIPKAAESIEEIAILRIDADLYESTMIGLEYFFPKLAEGGFLVLDDWLIPGARKAVSDYFEKHKLNNLLRHRVDETVCYWQKSASD